MPSWGHPQSHVAPGVSLASFLFLALLPRAGSEPPPAWVMATEISGPGTTDSQSPELILKVSGG